MPEEKFDCEIECTVNYNGQDGGEKESSNYSLDVDPSIAEVKIKDTVEWTISKGSNLPENVQSVAITKIAEIKGVDIFKGDGVEPHKRTGRGGKKWKGQVNSTSAGQEEDYDISYSITFSDCDVVKTHDPRLSVNP